MSYNPNPEIKENISRLINLIDVSGNALLDYGLSVVLPKLEENFYKLKNEVGNENFELLKQSFKQAIEDQRKIRTRKKSKSKFKSYQ